MALGLERGLWGSGGASSQLGLTPLAEADTIAVLWVVRRFYLCSGVGLSILVLPR